MTLPIDQFVKDAEDVRILYSRGWFLGLDKNTLDRHISTIVRHVKAMAAEIKELREARKFLLKEIDGLKELMSEDQL
jgi:hypothetical protein